MLSKNNKILIGCLALFLVMSVGYALFSDTITINGSATAKGDFEITAEVIDLSDDIYYDVEPTGGKVSNGIVENPTIGVSNNEVTSSVTLGAPGSYHVFGIKVKNTGSIPARLKSIEDITNGTVLFGSEDATYFNGHCVGERNKNQICADLSWEDGYWNDYEDDITAGTRFTDATYDDAMLEAILDPGEETYYFINYRWDENSTEQGEPLNLNWKIKINWEQITQ